MSAQTVIDSLEFAQGAQQLEGALPVAGMVRLKDVLLDDGGAIRFELKGGKDARGRPVLDLGVSGALHLQCQRCLGVLEHPLRIASRLLLDAAEQEVTDEPGAEWIEASSELDVATLVEDEILLSLPYAPRHEEGRCQAADGTKPAGAAGALAGLAALKRRTH